MSLNVDIMSISDIEIITIFICLLFAFLCSLKKRDAVVSSKGFLAIDLDMSFVMKGIACVFVLMGHYVSLTTSTINHGGISLLIRQTTANIGLTWFMFFSGYGLSLKNLNSSSEVSKMIINRLLKVFTPLLLVCSIATLLYALLPNKFSPEEIAFYGISTHIDGIHDGDILTILKCVIGWLDWYVYCIMIFYSIYYASAFISLKFKINITILLCIFFVCYFVLAYVMFGSLEAHWYRYIWAFLLGHIIAIQGKISKFLAFVVLLPFVLLVFLESKLMILSYIIAICAIFFISMLGKNFSIKLNAPLLFVGSVSYFYYLAHIRIAWHAMVYLSINSLIVWSIISLIVAYLLKLVYDKINILK